MNEFKKAGDCKNTFTSRDKIYCAGKALRVPRSLETASLFPTCLPLTYKLWYKLRVFDYAFFFFFLTGMYSAINERAVT